MKRIHIVGSGPRTGTTLLASAMVTCFHIDHYCEHEASLATDEPKDGNCFLTKQPGEIGILRWPLTLNKDLYAICIIRDPRDMIVSRHGSHPDVYWTGLRYWKLFLKHFSKLRQHPRFIYLKYEDFVADPDSTQRLLINRMPFLEKKHNFSEYHLFAKPGEKSLKALKNVRPIAAVGVGGWRDHLPRIKEQILIHGSMTEGLIAHGYEKDHTWISCLNGIPQKEFEQNRPQKLRVRDRAQHVKTLLIELINITLRKLGLNTVVIKKPFALTSLYVEKILRLVLKKSTTLFRL